MDAHSVGTSTAGPEAVWSVLSDVDAWPSWTPTVTAVERVAPGGGGHGGGDVGVGATFVVAQPRLGRATWVVTEWEPKSSFTWVSRRPGVRTTATHRLRPEGSGTRIELAVAWAGPGAWLARALFGRMTQRYTDLELRSLVTAAGGGRSA